MISGTTITEIIVIQAYQIIITPDDNSSEIGLEPKEEGEGIKFSLNYEEKEQYFGVFLKSYQIKVMD